MKQAKQDGNSYKNWKNTKVSELLKMACGIALVMAVLLTLGCSGSEPANTKTGSLLQTQVNLKKEQLVNPTDDRLIVMQSMGMRVDNLKSQRIFIHLQELPDDSQVKEIESMGVILYLTTWIPPLDNHPTGFLLADMPVEKLVELAEIDYIIRLETAERALEPHDGSQPQ